MPYLLLRVGYGLLVVAAGTAGHVIDPGRSPMKVVRVITAAFFAVLGLAWALASYWLLHAKLANPYQTELLAVSVLVYMMTAFCATFALTNRHAL